MVHYQRFRVVALCLGLVLLLVAVGFGAWVAHGLNTPIKAVQKPTVIVILPGQSLQHLANDLNKKQWLAHPQIWSLAARLQGQQHAIRAGEYQVDPGITPAQLLQLFVSGQMRMHAFTIVEGWTFAQLRAAIAAEPYLKHVLTGLSEDQVMQRIGAPGKRAEGRFMPDTYFFVQGTDDSLILERAFQAQHQFLQHQWATRAPEAEFLCPYKGLILASLLEKEAVADERPLVAGVLLNRLHKPMRLQVDAAVRYGLGLTGSQALTHRDLRVQSPYNTYRHLGLPPTPIALPSRASIVAAFHPQATSAWYYVADGHGYHIFSKTWVSHRRHIRQLFHVH